MKSMKGLGSAANILQLYKNADVNQFILMSRESSLSHSAGSPPQRPTGTAEQSITETTNNNTATPEDQQPYWRVTSQLGFLAPPPPMSPDVSKTEDKAEVVEHDQIKRSRGSLEKMSILMCSFKSKVDGPIQKEDSANVPSSALSESCNLPPFRAPPAPPLRSALANDEILEQDEDLPMALLDTGDVDSSKQQELQAGHQVVVLRDTHTHEGKAHHAGEVMVFEKEGTHGWTYVRDGKGVFCWLPSNALKAAGSGEADGRLMRTVLVPSSDDKTFRHSSSPISAPSSTGKRRSRGQFSPIRKHHVSPAIPPALTPLPRGQHVLWDDEAVEVDHDEPAHRPDHLLSAYHSQVRANSADGTFQNRALTQAVLLLFR